jgi:hypothetical protein
MGIGLILKIVSLLGIPLLRLIGVNPAIISTIKMILDLLSMLPVSTSEDEKQAKAAYEKAVKKRMRRAALRRDQAELDKIKEELEEKVHGPK